MAKQKQQDQDNKFPLPIYPDTEDIYSKDKRVDPAAAEENSPIKEHIGKQGQQNEKGFGDLLTGDDLDVPGAELDDADEAIGEEDEENDYYSLGGDDHQDLEEDKGD